MIAIAYARRSAKSEEKTVSLEIQIEHIKAYCERRGFEIRATITHDGISGRKRRRFDEIERVVKEFKPGAIVFYHQDRFARDSAGLADYFADLVKRGIEIHEAGGAGKVDYTGAIGRMSTNIRAVTDQFYAEMIGEKTRDALASLRSGGKRFTHIPPLGFYYENGLMVPEPEEQRALEILERCAAAGLGARRALKVLEAGEYRGRQSLKVIHRALKRYGENHA